MSDWLDDVQADKTAMAEVKQAVERWRELKFAMEEAEAQLEYRKKLYDDYVKEFCSLLRRNGLEQMRLTDGSTIEVAGKVRCSVLKGKQNEVAAWLRENGADNLVSSQLIVMPSAKAKLDELKIGYDEEVKMNTNSIKAWVKGEIEVGNVGLQDLPSGLSWYMYDEIVSKEA